MRTALFSIMIVIAMSSIAMGVPDLQLFIAGANYDLTTSTWVTTSSSFDLYVVSANKPHDDVIVSMALGMPDNPDDVDVNFDGTVISNTDWTYGYAPIDNVPDQWNGGNDDLPRHGIFPTNFVEMNTGDYETDDLVGNVRPNLYGNYWNPATGEGNANRWGDVKSFHVEVGGVFSYIHFDAYTLNSDGTIREFAPFSHDAEVTTVPEPGSVYLLGSGLIGLGAFAFKRRKKQ